MILPILILLGLLTALICANLEGKLIRGGTTVGAIKVLGYILFAVALFHYLAGPAIH